MSVPLRLKSRAATGTKCPCGHSQSQKGDFVVLVAAVSTAGAQRPERRVCAPATEVAG